MFQPPQTLTPSLIKLLEACVDDPDADITVLAKNLGRRPATVRTQFALINQRLGTHTRLAAVVMALQNQWIQLPK